MEGDAFESDDDYDELDVGGWESFLSPKSGHVAAYEDKDEEDQKSSGDSSIPNENSLDVVQDFPVNEAIAHRYAAKVEVDNASIEVQVEAAVETSTRGDNAREIINNIVGEVPNSTYQLQPPRPVESGLPCPIGVVSSYEKSPISFELVSDI